MPALGQALLVIITALGQALLVIITALGQALLVIMPALGQWLLLIMPALFSNFLIMPAQLVRHSMKNARPLLIVKSEFQGDNGLTASSKESVNLTENVGEYYGGDRHEIFTD